MSINNKHVTKLVKEIICITQDLENESSVLTDSQRGQLIKNAELLAIAARKPEENLYYQATQTAQNSAIRTAIGMGVFEKIPSSGDGVGMKELSKMLNVEELLLIRIMRACASGHFFHETSSMHYIHNDMSAAFVDCSNRDMFQQMYDFVGRALYTMPYYLESHGYKNPTDPEDSPFQYGHDTALGLFDYLMEEPERMKLFNSGMQSAAASRGSVAAVGPYPFGKQLETVDIQDKDVLIVDVGGGKGHVLKEIRATWPDLKGRMILQDLPDAIEDAKASDLPDSIETLASSFFDPHPIQNAHIYYFRRIFHDWSNTASLTILRHTRAAMAPNSRILIVDTVVPEKDAPRSIALQDLNMMSFGGMERTKEQWKSLLGEAGLEVRKFWAGGESLQMAIEAVLAA